MHPPRAVLVHLREMFKAELDNMEELGVIVRVNEAADWVNSVVVGETVNDNGEITKLGVCLDPRDLNKCVKREHYHMTTVDDVVTELHDAKYFIVIDATKGYWHIPPAKESSLPTTFNTPFRRYRFTRMLFGLNVSQEISKGNSTRPWKDLQESQVLPTTTLSTERQKNMMRTSGS